MTFAVSTTSTGFGPRANAGLPIARLPAARMIEVTIERFSTRIFFGPIGCLLRLRVVLVSIESMLPLYLAILNLSHLQNACPCEQTPNL
jgi:hypothetical protein